MNPSAAEPKQHAVGGVFVLVLVVVAVAAPLIAPYDPVRQSLRGRLSAPTLAGADGKAHLLGTDHLGRDVLSRAIYGARVSLLVGLAGPVERTKLMQMATKIGVADSARFLSGHSSAFVKLSTPGAYQPDRLLDKVGSTLAATESLVTGLHVLTFNQVRQAEEWRQALLSQLSARASR